MRVAILAFQFPPAFVSRELCGPALHLMRGQLDRVIEITPASIASKLVRIRTGRCWHRHVLLPSGCAPVRPVTPDHCLWRRANLLYVQGRAIHSEAGEITLSQMLHEWALHDLGKYLKGAGPLGHSYQLQP